MAPNDIIIWSIYCGRQEEPAILIFRLLLPMRRMYVASFHLDFHEEWMECKECNLIIRVWTLITRNLITRVLTIYHVNLAQSKALEKRFALDRCRPHSITFGYY